MKVILFGATGMVGQGVLRECLLDPEVASVLVLGRAATGRHDAKLKEIVRSDLFDLTAIEGELTGIDACFFCLGVSSAGMAEAAYRKVTYELTAAVAQVLLKQSPGLTFVFVSGAGTNSVGGSMWARVKGETENMLLQLPFKGAYMFRPAFIQAMHGEVSRTRLYRLLYPALIPLTWALKAVLPKLATTTEKMGLAMLEVAKRGDLKRILESPDINEAAARSPRRPNV